MANIDAPFGLRPVRHLNGMSWNGQTERCYIGSSYATALYIGDAVELTEETDDQDTTAQHMSIMFPTMGDTNPLLGVITSFEPLSTDTTKNYNPASTERYANVCVDPSVIYYVQDDGSAVPTKLLPGQNACLINTHSGSTATGLSGLELDLTTPAANASFQLLIMRMARLPDNELAIHAIWEVLINLHQLRCTGDGDGMLGVTAT